MKKVKLSDNGPLVSPIIAGVMKWGKWGAKLGQVEMAKLIESSLALGVSTFDHADIYGAYTTEAEFGQAFKQTKISRKKIQLITKCGIKIPCDQRPQYQLSSYDHSNRHIKASVDQSLQNLKTNYIDLLLIHRPGPLMDPQEIAECIADLKSSGKVLHFGVSNFTDSQMKLMEAQLEMCTNQIEVSLKQTDPFTNGTLDYCFSKNIRPMAWSPVGGGKWLQTVKEKFSVLENDLGYDLDILCYAFLLHHPSGIVPVMGTSKIERIKKALKALEVKLSDEQWYSLYVKATGMDLP